MNKMPMTHQSPDPVRSRPWMIPLVAVALLLAVFTGYILAPRAESSVNRRPNLTRIICPMPPKPRSGRPLAKQMILPVMTLSDRFFMVQSWETGPEQIFPMLTYIEARATREITAYNAGDINQCSGDPCISANGENICRALDKGLKRCAANFVPLGTRLWIENVGDCLVTDRMHYRYKHRVDLAMPLAEKEKALAFGLKKLEVKILSQM